MIKLNKKFVSFALVAAITGGSFGAMGNAYETTYAASVAYNNFNAKLSHLESSLERNYLGSSNLPTFRKYLAEANELLAKVTSNSEKEELQARYNECEAIIITTEHIVNMERSMDINYRGMKNVAPFQDYVDKVNAAIPKINNKTIANKIAERSAAGSNIIQDIKVADSSEYKSANALLAEAINSINEGKTSEAKEKATEGLTFAEKCTNSLLKTSIIEELKTIQNM